MDESGRDAAGNIAVEVGNSQTEQAALQQQLLPGDEDALAEIDPAEPIRFARAAGLAFDAMTCSRQATTARSPP